MNSPSLPPESPPPASRVAENNEFYCAADYRPEDSVGYLMRRVLGLIGGGIERELESSDLTNAQWFPLFKLSLVQTSTVAELARDCLLDCGAMTRLLDRLEAKGLCRRVRSVADRRVVNIELTEAGRAVASGIPAVLSRVQNAHLAGFSQEEFELLKSFLRRILANAQTPFDDHPFSGSSHDL